MAFAEGSIEPVVLEFYKHAQLLEEKKASAHQQEELARHRAQLNDVLKIVDAGLNGREVLVGGHFTAADLVMALILHFANTLKLLEGHPRLPPRPRYGRFQLRGQGRRRHRLALVLAMVGVPSGDGRRPASPWRQSMNAPIDLAAVAVLFAQRAQAA